MRPKNTLTYPRKGASKNNFGFNPPLHDFKHILLNSMSERRGNRKRKSKITDEEEDSDFEDNNIKAPRISTLSAEDHVCAQYILASLQKHKYADPFR